MIVKMKKLNVIGLKSEKKKVLDVLRVTGCFELSHTGLLQGQITGEGSVDPKYYEELHRRLHTVGDAISWAEAAQTQLKDEFKANKQLFKQYVAGQDGTKKISKKPLFFHRKEVLAKDISEAEKRGDELYGYALKVIGQRQRIEAIDVEYGQNIEQRLRLELYKNVDARLGDIKDTKHLFMLLGRVDKRETSKLKAAFAGMDGHRVEIFAGDKAQCAVFVSGPIEHKEAALRALNAYKFENAELNYDSNAKDAIDRLNEKSRDLFREKLDILRQAAGDSKCLNDLKLYHDCIMLEIESMDAQKDIAETRKTFCIEGWIPAENAGQIVSKIKESTACVECEVFDIAEGDEPPTLTRSNALISPYEAVTNMYSPPSPFERDPNPFVAIFFFIFFGIMIGDAVYGIVLFALTFVLMRCYKMDTGFKKLMMILCMGGVSAFIWGAVYNSWAAVGLPYNPVINPVLHPFDFLLITLGLGYFQIIFGFVLKLVANIKAKDYLAALADSGWKLFIMIGGALNIPSMLSIFEKQLTVISMPAMPAALEYAGLAMIVAGLIGMLFTGGRKKSGIAGKVASGIGSWYDIVGLLSDILSYCRLFGLALSGAIIGTVANILAKDVLFNIPGVGYPLGIVVSVFFHIFNLALACLGAYVHNSRLQFVEFFGKFYEGGGRVFKPMGHCTKYTSIKQ